MPKYVHNCSICSKKCKSRLRAIQCINCLSCQHKNCWEVTKPKSSLLCTDCLAEILPFQKINNLEFDSLFQTSLNKSILKQVNDAAEDQNNLEYLAKTDCKCRNLDWFNEFTKKARRSNDILQLHLNVRSLSKNILKIEDLLKDCTDYPDILAITETKLKDKNANQISLNNYDFIFNNSVTNSRGIGFYILSNNNYSRRPDLNFSSADSENLCIEIDTSCNKKLIIGVILQTF